MLYLEDKQKLKLNEHLLNSRHFSFFIFIRRIFQKITQATRNEASKQVFLTPSPAPPVTPEVGAHVEGYLCVGGAEQERLPVKSSYHTS